MERITERKTLSFNKGMTNVPSDLLSDDSELLESDGFIFKDGEMKPIQKPVKIKVLEGEKDSGLGAGSTIMYVHKMADYKCIITKLEHTDSIICYKMNGDQIDINSGQSFSIGAPSDIKSVGNTLVCATEKGIHYLLYKGGKYVDLGTELPKPKVEFRFEEVENPFKANDGRSALKIASFLALYKSYKAGMYYDTQGRFIGAYTTPPSSYAYKYPNEFGIESVENSKLDDFRNAVQGHVTEAINWAKEKGYFCFPFFVRFALRLFDGTYTKISNPIICYPTISRNCEIRFATSDKKYTDNSGVEQWQGNIIPDNVFVGTFDNYFYFIHCTKMLCNFSISQIENWKDIVKEIVVFASDDVLPFKLNGECWSLGEYFEENNKTLYDTILDGIYVEKSTFFHVGKDKLPSSLYDSQQNPYQAILPTYKTDAEIREELMSKSQFYKLFSIDINDKKTINSGTYTDTLSTQFGQALVKGQILKTLTNQEQLKNDDYYSWTTMKSSKLFPYNGRLNLIGTKRFPFAGFNVFRGNNGGASEESSRYIKFFVHISSSTMDTWVSSQSYAISESYNIYNDWYYYPDPNAKEMLIVVSRPGETTLYYNVSLKIHPRLYGSYSFNALPPKSLGIGSNIANMTTGGYEDLNSQIFTSVVNNPFVFEASGDNTVGTGKILGIIANTEAVSQGQFGQYPLMVFTDEGIYGMSVNSEGLYSASYPISREVSNESSPLVPTDRLVFFTSKKGLMAASGGSVACMSEQLKGRTSNGANITSEGRFLDFIKDCMIAYDYRDSLLRIYNKSKSYQYIYNMVDKTFSVVSNNDVFVKAVVNDYPDNLIQDTEGNVYTLTGKPDVFDDDRLYSGEIITRPLKLGGSMILKSIRDIKHLCDTINGTLQLEIFGSNDCREWTQLTSTGGKPYKYYTFKYIFNNFLAGDSFAGSVVEIQRRRDDKMR